MNVAQELEKYGISQEVTRRFTSDVRPDVLDYLDLIESAEESSTTELYPDGVAENNDLPLLYFVNHSRLAHSPDSQDSLDKLGRHIACRGERAYLAIIKPGSLEVRPVSLDDVQPGWKSFDASSNEAINFFTNLAHAKFDFDRSTDPDLVFDEMYKLLLTGADQIRHRIGKENVLALIGRSLFFRFLCDRKIITENDTQEICATASELRACFDNAENTYRTSRWLDETFNGDFLPLSDRGTRQFFDDLNRSKIIYTNLSAIVRGLEPTGDNEFQYRFTWASFNFAHVPVGLLSQVYEAFCWKWEEKDATETSVHYTPRNIAKTLVDEAFDGLVDAHKAKVLDPACGAGVFLVLAFRRLYVENWKKLGKRPDTKAIRRILENQLSGFDISDSALRLSALSLYLTAIELDPQPIPPEKLKFQELDNSVLFNHRLESDPETGAIIGSLGDHVGDQFNEQFDLILCNPPWTRIRDNEKLVGELDTVSREVVSRLDEAIGQGYKNPDAVPDLPFLWKATQWCKANGRIAMALPSRSLFKQGDISRGVRAAMFGLVEFTGIVNCSNVRKTNVWPEMDQPFMLVFAKNTRPSGDNNFWFICPQADTSINEIGELRIDAQSAHSVNVEDVLDQEWLLKTLSIGTALDAAVIEKICRVDSETLEHYWLNVLKLQSRKGYTIDGKGSKKDATLMKNLIDAGKTTVLKTRFTIKPKLHQKFDYDKLYRTLLMHDQADPLQVYRAPILLLRKSLPTDRRKGNALTSYVDIAFNQSFYGYSASGHPKSVLLIQYLQLFAHSNIWEYFALNSSSSLGAERPVFLKSDFDASPVIPLEALSTKQHSLINALAKRLEAEDLSVFEEVDAFFGALYGLDKYDLQVIEDTLTVRNPHDELGKRASTPPTAKEANSFQELMSQALNPFFKKLKMQAVLTPVSKGTEHKAFQFFSITSDNRTEASHNWNLNKAILDIANQTGASQVIQKGKGRLLIGLLNQYRYWTPSRARLLAGEILREHFSVFEENE